MGPRTPRWPPTARSIYVPGRSAGPDAHRGVDGSTGTCLAAAGPPTRILPRRPGVPRRRAARARDPTTMWDLRCRTRRAEPADDRTARESARSGRPTAQRIIFTSNPGGYPELFWRPADGTGSDSASSRAGKDLLDLLANGWSPDGTAAVYRGNGKLSVRDRAGRRSSARSEGQRAAEERGLQCPRGLSPDGRWMAYRRDVSGRFEIYVERYPELGDRETDLGWWRDVSQPGRVTAGSCSSSVWTPGRFRGRGAVRDDARSPGARSCCSN